MIKTSLNFVCYCKAFCVMIVVALYRSITCPVKRQCCPVGGLTRWSAPTCRVDRICWGSTSRFKSRCMWDTRQPFKSSRRWRQVRPYWLRKQVQLCLVFYKYRMYLSFRSRIVEHPSSFLWKNRQKLVVQWSPSERPPLYRDHFFTKTRFSVAQVNITCQKISPLQRPLLML
jgi:hypothetical protein